MKLTEKQYDLITKFAIKIIKLVFFSIFIDKKIGQLIITMKECLICLICVIFIMRTIDFINN